jgi:uncharacterized protein YndB with AHSA1/START domain
MATSSGMARVTSPTDTQIQITREFDAPKHLVYKAWTTPEYIKRWFSEGGGEITISDLRPGGTWRYVMKEKGGSQVAAHGEYREVVPNERVVSTEIFEGMPEAEAMQTVTFSEKDGRTTLTILVQHASPKHREAHIKSVEGGMQKALSQLEQVAVSLR